MIAMCTALEVEQAPTVKPDDKKPKFCRYLARVYIEDGFYRGILYPLVGEEWREGEWHPVYSFSQNRYRTAKMYNRANAVLMLRRKIAELNLMEDLKPKLVFHDDPFKGAKPQRKPRNRKTSRKQ